MTTPTDDLTHTNSGRITGRRVVNGRDVFTVSPAFGESFEVVRYEDDSGEAVAWQYRNVTEEGPSPFWHDIDKAKFELLRNDPHAEVRKLFTHPRTVRDHSND